MKLRRFLRRAGFYLQKGLLRSFVFINHRMYMRLYASLLKRSGFNLRGTPRFIAYSAKFDDFDLISLGDRVVISMNVHFLTHDYSVTTALIALHEIPSADIRTTRRIVIGDNVFVGMNSILLPGTHVGNNVIIGAGSVVRGSIPDFSVVAGNPAQVVGDIRDHAVKLKARKGGFQMDKH